MAAEDCLQMIRAAAGQDLPEDTLDELITELQRRADDQGAGETLGGPETALRRAAERLADEVAQAAQIERRNRLLDVKVSAEVLRLADLLDREVGDPSRAFVLRNVGSNRRVPGARLSVDARGNALVAQYLGGMIADLRRQDLLPLLNSRALDREIAQELAELSKARGAPGASGSRHAVSIARVIDKYRRAAVARENRAGAWFRLGDGSVVRQSHDLHKVRRAGFKVWRDSVLPLLDAEATFQGADAGTVMRAIYDSILQGHHIRAKGASETDLGFAFDAGGRLVRRAPEQRVLRFRDADAWYDYNQRFGGGTLMEAIFQDLERSARNTALMEAWGSNPRTTFEKLRAALKKQHRGERAKVRKLGRAVLRHQFDEVEGLTRIPVNPSSAQVTASVMSAEIMMNLGNAALSAFGDLGFKAAALRDTGDNLLSAWVKTLESSLEGLAPAERRITAELLGVGLDGQIGGLTARLFAADDAPGNFTKLQRIFLKLNLRGPLIEANKRGMALMSARDLAMNAHLDWGDLPQRDLLELYGFDQGRWNLVRRASRREADGRGYLMPDAIRDLPDAAFADLVPSGKLRTRAIQQLRDEMETALRSYYVDLADQAQPTPGARERAFLRRGTRPGTPLGIALRLMGQFKEIPVTVATKVLGRAAGADTVREFFENLAKGRADLLGMVHTIVAATLLGYAAQTAKELAKGREPRDPFSADTWTAALLQGGGLALYADFLFGEMHRLGPSLLGGPAAGTAADLADLFARARAGEDAAAEALGLLADNLPGANLFYTRIALDYLILFQFQESLNPGFLRRMERRLKEERGQSFILPPTQAIPRGGGHRPLEGVR